jgi:hypothetical protein
MIIHVYSRRVGGRTDSDGGLSPRQREELTAAIAAELVRMRDAAVAAGVSPEVLAEAFEERRRAIVESGVSAEDPGGSGGSGGSAGAAVEDVQSGGGDAPDHGGVGQ